MFPAAHFSFCQRPVRSYSASEIKSTEQIAPMNPASLGHTDDVTYGGAVTPCGASQATEVSAV